MLDKLVDELKRGLALLRSRSHKATDHARLRLEKAGLQREQERLFKRLGHDLYILHRQGITAPESLRGMLGELERLEAEIQRKGEAVGRLLAGEQDVQAAPLERESIGPEAVESEITEPGPFRER